MTTQRKTLFPVDIKLPEHCVKGAVIVDEDVAEWNPAVTLDKSAQQSTFIVIDRSKEKTLEEGISKVIADLKLPEGEYSLAFEEPRVFLTDKNLDRIQHGFIITITASPEHYARRLLEVFQTRKEIAKLEWALTKLDIFATDPCFVEAFYGQTNIDSLYALLNEERIEKHTTMLPLLLHAISSFLELNVNGIGWSSLPEELVDKLATHVTGRAKLEDPNTVRICLQMIENLVNCDNDNIRTRVLSDVPLHTLIRHLEKSDERVNLAALSLMNSIHKKSSDIDKLAIVKHLCSKPFKAAIAGSVLRTGRARERGLLEQLVPLQQLILNELFLLSKEEATEDDCRQLLEKDVFMFAKCDITNDVIAIRASGLGRLAITVFSSYVKGNEDALKMLISENEMRTQGKGWQLIPMFIHCLTIVMELLSPENGCVEQLVELLYNLESPADTLFAIVVKLFHRTWREMHAAEGEGEKVGKVVREQLRRTAESRHLTIKRLEEDLISLPYWKLQELWKKEEMTKESDQLASGIVSELRQLLRPSIEELVRKNRKNFMKQGFTFKRTTKTKSSKEMYWHWKLDQSEKIITTTTTDSDTYVEGLSFSGVVKKVCIKDINAVQWGEDGMATTKKGGVSRGLQVHLDNGEVLYCSASKDAPLSIWMDGLTDLIGHKQLSHYALQTVDRLLNVELRLRLLDVPNPKTDLQIPSLPDDFDWITSIQQRVQ